MLRWHYCPGNTTAPMQSSTAPPTSTPAPVPSTSPVPTTPMPATTLSAPPTSTPAATAPPSVAVPYCTADIQPGVVWSNGDGTYLSVVNIVSFRAPVLHDAGIRNTLGATVTSEIFIIVQCSACQEVPQPRSVDCHPSVRLSRNKQRPTRVSNGRVGFFLPCPCNTAGIPRAPLACQCSCMPGHNYPQNSVSGQHARMPHLALQASTDMKPWYAWQHGVKPAMHSGVSPGNDQTSCCRG